MKLCIKNEELCIKNEELCIATDDFLQETSKPQPLWASRVVAAVDSSRGAGHTPQRQMTVSGRSSVSVGWQSPDQPDGSANCNQNANLFRIFQLKMQK